MKPDRETRRRTLARSCAALLLFILAADTRANAGDPPATQVVIIGDSIMRAVSHSLKRELAGHAGVKADSFTFLRPGLSRLDLFDWLAVIGKISKEKKPDIAVVMFGAGGRRPIHISTGAAGIADLGEGVEDDPLSAVRVIKTDDPEWSREYARRVGAAMDIMIGSGVKRIFWIELPDMREAGLQEDSLAINKVIQGEAAARPKVTVLSSKKILSRSPGVYSSYIYNTNGMPVEVRSSDGVNFNEKGAGMLAGEIVSRIHETRSDNAP